MSTYLQTESDSDAEEVSGASPEEIAEVHESNEKLKAEGNAAFSSGNLELSVQKYSEAIANLKKLKLSPNCIYHLNRSAAYLGMKNYVRALHDANKAAEIDPNNWKAHWRKGVSLMSMSKRMFRTQQAVKAFESCLQCETLPAEKIDEVNIELSKTQRLLQQQEAETPTASLQNCAPS